MNNKRIEEYIYVKIKTRNGKECEEKDNGRDGELDYEKLYLYLISVINKQNAIIKSYENIIKLKGKS